MKQKRFTDLSSGRLLDVFFIPREKIEICSGENSLIMIGAVKLKHLYQVLIENKNEDNVKIVLDEAEILKLGNDLEFKVSEEISFSFDFDSFVQFIA